MIPSDIVIVIGRRFGSGGRKVGRLLAERLGVAYYDRELLSEAAESLGFDKWLFQQSDEKRPSPLRSILSSTFGITGQYSSGGLSHEQLYAAQSKVMRKLAEGGAVFVGRSADYILREHPHILSVFLHAPIGHRVEKLLKRGECADAQKARELAKRIDGEREDFYNYFTGRRWGTADNYHLTLDSSLLDEEKIADLIIRYLEARF